MIAPVIYMWRPSQLPKRNVEEKVGDCVGNDGPVSNGDHADSRKLWLWIHASSFSEGYASLKLACQKQVSYILYFSLLKSVLVVCLMLYVFLWRY